MIDALLQSFSAVFTDPTTRFVQCVAAAQLNFNATSRCVTADSYSLTFSLMIAMTVFCFVASFITKNDSWVDRLWSVSPVVYAWVFALYGRHQAAVSPYHSNFLFATLITLWGIRLTYNFFRKGGYSKGHEDYRWAYVRKWPIFQYQLVWLVFSFAVVSLFQSLLLWAIVVPVQLLPSAPWTAADKLFAGMFATFLALEAQTDQQQWEFQNEKQHRRPRRSDVDYTLGFCIDGVFAFSRHLNVWSEQMMWVSVFLAGASHTGSIVHASALGCLVLMALTIRSTQLTEQISCTKYPHYRLYQRTTPMLVPTLRATDGVTRFLTTMRTTGSSGKDE